MIERDMIRRYISTNANLDISFSNLFSDRQFQCFYLYCLLGATAEQTGEIMGVTSGTIEQYRQRIKKVLKQEGLHQLNNFELWREVYQRNVIRQYVAPSSSCLTTNFIDIRSESQKRDDPELLALSDFLIPDQSLDSSLADVMTVRQQQCGYLYMIGATYDQIGELLGFSRSNAVEHVAHVREGLEGFGMLKASRLVGWLFFFAHNYIRQEVHPESPLLRLNFKDIRGLLGMNKEQFCNW